MRFSFEGFDYQLEFQRDYRSVQIGVDELGNDITARSKFPYTTVTLYVKDQPTGGLLLFRTFTVGAYHRDTFSLEKGRINALRRLTATNSLTKEFKTAIWKAYMDRKKEKPNA